MEANNIRGIFGQSLENPAFFHIDLPIRDYMVIQKIPKKSVAVSKYLLLNVQ